MKEKSMRASSKETGLKLIETAKARIVRVAGTDREVKVTGTDHEAIVSMPNALIMITGCGT
jgi:hypothetical protein